MRQKIIRFVFGCIAIFCTSILISSTSKAQNTALRPLKVVHLGDSYSAGNGTRTDFGDRNYHGVSGCYRSPTNWGSQFIESLGDVYSVTYVNRACSGGVIDNILNEREMDSSFKRFNGSCPSAEYPDEEFFKDDSIFRCTRFLKPQIDAIDTNVDLVIMTMGGNDIQFAKIVQKCFVRGFRGPGGCREAVENATTDLADVEEDLINTFAEIRKRLGSDSRVIFVTYPHLVPDIDYNLRNIFNGDIYNVSQEVRTLSVEGDRRQKAAVEAANAAAGEEYIVFFDDTKELFEGHLPDPIDTNPRRWIHEAYETLTLSEWYHYNPLGHQNLGSALSVIEIYGAVELIQIVGANIGESLNFNETSGEVSAGTGAIVPSASELTDMISEIPSEPVNQPFAWIGTAYSGKIDQPILFNASGSYDPSGELISLYEWDYDGDGIFDFETEEITTTHTYTEAFNDFVVLRVTGAGGTALASARTVVNADGFVSQGDETPCELDENGFSIIVNETGRFTNCSADNLPEVEGEGIQVVIGTPAALDEADEPITALIFLPIISQ